MHAYRTNSRIPWGRIIPLRGQLEYSIAGNKDMIKISDFLSRNLFGENLSKSQYDEISRLLQQDLLSRYGELVGKRKFNAALLFVKDKNEIIGCAGIDTQEYDNEFKKFSKCGPSTNTKNTRVVLANLSVRADKRRLGLASKLTQKCESLAKEWNFGEVYLLVDSENDGARRFYVKQDYKEIFRDSAATRVRASPSRLRTEACTNICMRKSFSPAAPDNPLFNFFSFWNKK